MEKIYTIAEVAELLHLSTSTLYKYTEANKIASIKLGNRIRISDDAVTTYLNSCTNNANQQKKGAH